MDLSFQLQSKTSRWLLVVGLVALTHISFQFLLLPYGNALRSLLPDSLNSTYDKSSSPIGPSLTKSAMVRNPLAVDLSGLKNYSIVAGLTREKDANKSTGDADIEEDQGQKESVGATENGIASKGRDVDESVEVVLDRDPDNEFPSDDLIINEDETQAIDEEERLALESVKTQRSDVGLALVSEAQHDLPFEQNLRTNHENPMNGILGEDLTVAHQEFEHANGNATVASAVPENHVANLKNESSMKSNPGRKKMRCEMPPNSITSIEEMDHILLRHRRSSRSMRPRWSSARDQEIFAARSEIENAPIMVKDQDLYAPLFRNVSKFKR
uniref:Uncharacterized protein n=4 Tax=Rhizophora mucronata TaxID=61149 RepID=A0A2P2LL80_RHIMU